jgi:dTDP-4-dehydrorhamnose reductase
MPSRRSEMRFTVLGAAGQLGRDLCPLLPGDVIPLGREQADLTREESLRACLLQFRPDVIINCAAYNFVDRAEAELPAAFAVNAWGVRELARICNELDAVLVHFSTDYVFGLDTSRNSPYSEADSPGPVNAYGLSKLTGEYSLRVSCSKHFIIRTCGLYGVHGSGGKGGNFVETMLLLADRGTPIRVVNDQRCTPSYTQDVAEAAIALMATQQYGLHHVTNRGSCTWYEFARTIFELAGKTVNLSPISSKEYGALARRPAYSVLESASCQKLRLPVLPEWPAALETYLTDRSR